VELVRPTGKTVAEDARHLSINDTTPGNWSRLTTLSGAGRTEVGCFR
jgi:hypothetical protein